MLSSSTINIINSMNGLYTKFHTKNLFEQSNQGLQNEKPIDSNYF
jgi:hypothetical protein